MGKVWNTGENVSLLIRGNLLEVPTLGVLVNVGRGNTMGRSESGLVILKVDA